MVINFDINFLTSVCESEGFGINTDLFDTNVLNLTFVIAVLVYYGRSLLSDLIKNRKEIVLRNLQEADNKFREASENLAFAKKQFESSKLKAEQIRDQGFVLANQASQKLMESLEDDIKRMKDSTLATIRFEEEKSITEVCNKLNHLAFEKAIEKLKKRLNSNVQKKIIFQNIDRLSSKALIYK
uniref:ATP synthase subunit b, chloroplastic n=1 Tax=Discoplastis spathirhyncha TaxID=215771 RepID=A0A3G3LLA7_9EUGL|nr:ATPase subunit I [Discoplastis spathirhyncha]AYQ93490.1 ATPase subunit I [Discoplastis spathirhyncha]